MYAVNNANLTIYLFLQFNFYFHLINKPKPLNNKDITRVMGLMSGTSLDGLDICVVDFEKNNNSYKFEIVQSETIEYKSDWKNKLKNAFYLSENELKDLDEEYGSYLANQINFFIQKNELKHTIDLIASHGHTVFHQPQNKITIQIGDGKIIQQLTKINTINNFRITDVLLGGQGAPLVPVGDFYLFNQYQACLNLGGFSNISFDFNHERIAFDIAPCNLPINILTDKYYNLPYDDNGNIAQSGIVNADLLNELNHLRFYQLNNPKSLGFEWLNDTFLPIVFKCNDKPENLIRTITEHVAQQLTETFKKYNLSTILVTGGGAKNKFLIDLLQNENVEISIPNENIVNFKEALIFAFLGYLNLKNSINTFKSVTGATSDSIGGIRHFVHQQ